MTAIQGEWKCIAGEAIGKILVKNVVKKQDRRITIKGNSYTMKRTENGTRRAQTGKFEIDAVSGHFGFIGKEQSGAAREIIGIYELDGDTLKLCYRYKINDDCVGPTKLNLWKNISFSPFAPPRLTPLAPLRGEGSGVRGYAQLTPLAQIVLSALAPCSHLE